MSNKAVSEFFDSKASETYDERNRKLSPINNNLHLLIRLILNDLPENAHILCVGVGTGSEIVSLAEAYPKWRFTGIDPSTSMLEACRDKIEKHGLTSRCELTHGYLASIDEKQKFDAILCLLVTHFVTDDAERQAMYTGMHARLTQGGYLIHADISDDMASPEFRNILEKWKAMHRFAGASDASLEHVVTSMETHLSVLPKATIENFLRNAGFPMPVQFFQSLLIRAWYSQKM